MINHDDVKAWLLESNDLWKKIISLRNEAYSLQSRSAGLVLQVMKEMDNNCELITKGDEVVAYKHGGTTFPLKGTE